MPSVRLYPYVVASALFLGVVARPAAAQQRADYGTLSIHVRPPDAEIFIDGEKWTGSEGASLQVQLATGTHRVEIRSPQRQTFLGEVTIRPGETTPLNVSLTRSESSEAPSPPPPHAPPAEPTAPPRARPSGTAAQVTSGEDGFMIAPDYRITEINHHTGQLIGAYGGYVFAGQFLAGIGGYWQADSTDGTRLAYVGPVFEWRVFPDRTIGLNLHGLIGPGWRYADDFYYANFDRPRIDHRGMPIPVPVNTHYRSPYGWYGDVFFVAEPEAQVVVRLGSSMRLQGGVGYRAVSENGLSGVSGSISMQFGR